MYALDKRILKTKVVTKEILCDLIEGKTLAIRVPEFCEEYSAVTIAKSICANGLVAGYGDKRGVGRLGPGVYELKISEQSFLEYITTAPMVMTTLKGSEERSVIEGIQDFFRKSWDFDCFSPHYRGYPLRPIMARIMDEEGKGALPHNDYLQPDVNMFPWAKPLKEQLGMNIYLEVPEEGGELEIWDLSLSPEEYEKLRLDNSYGLDPNQLPLPTVSLQPQLGELILINTKRIHAIRKVEKGTRITISSFIGYLGKEHPLIIWS